MIEIIDNYLDNNIFEKVNNTVSNFKFVWNLSTKININAPDNEHCFHFFHNQVYEGKLNYKEAKGFVRDIVRPYSVLKNKKIRILRCRTNLFVKTSNTPIEMGYHKDYLIGKDIYTMLLYLEDSNGYTGFKNGEKIESKKNRMAIFPADVYHQTVTQTDVMFRRNINLNFQIDKE